MNFLQNINEETLLLVPSQLKEKILEKINSIKQLLNVKVMSLEELKKELYFDYDEDAILYLMEKYNYKYEVAKNYIENIYFLTQEVYKKDKLKKLLNTKKELIDNKLLKFNNLFKDSYKNKKVIVFGYDYINKFYNHMLSNFSNMEFIEKEKYIRNNLVYEFNTLEDEILFVVREIINLINKGVDINKIYLLNIDSSYNNELLKLFRWHNIPIDIDKTSNIGTTIFIKDCMNKLKECQNFNETLDYMQNKYDLSNDGISQLYNKLINIFNKYIELDYKFEKIFEAIEYQIKNTNINKNNLKKYVRISSLNNNYFTDDEYVFLLGFNQGIIPKIYKNEEYITDDLKDEISIEYTTELNKKERKSTIENINSIKNIIITYKLKNKEDELYPSNLLNEINFEKIKKEIDDEQNYSKDYTEIILATMIDNLIKYGEKNSKLSYYYNSVKIPYREYDNEYTKIENSALKKYLNNKLVLSYSNLDTYYKCKFRYYLDNILKINKYEETFNTFIGSLFHFVLSKIYKENFNMEDEFEYFIKDKTFTPKEKFFLNKLKKELKIICDRLKTFNEMTGLTNVFTEKVISVDKTKEIEVIFKGIVDKIMYKQYDGKELVAIIDYKTGNTDIDLYNSNYGIGMQLLIYLYLISKSNLFENYEFVGFYLQKILNSEVNIEQGKKYIDIKNNNLKLFGYSTDDVSLLERFDTTYENSEYISGMKYGKNGFYKYSKILTNTEMENFIKLVDKKIEAARDSILECDFSINPKKLNTDKDITGCKFCHYKDICFRKNEDIINIIKKTDLSFLKEVSE